MRILEKQPNNLDDALNMDNRLLALDLMRSTGLEAEQGKSRFADVGRDLETARESKGLNELLWAMPRQATARDHDA